MKSLQQRIDEHLGLSGPDPEPTGMEMADAIAAYVDNQEGEISASDAWLLMAAARHIREMADDSW